MVLINAEVLMKCLPHKGVRTIIIVCAAFLIAATVAEAQMVRSQVRVQPATAPSAADAASMVNPHVAATPRPPLEKIKMVANPNLHVMKAPGDIQKMDKDVLKLKPTAEGMQPLSGSVITQEQKQEIAAWMNSVSGGFAKAADYLDVAFPQIEITSGLYGTDFAHLVVLVTTYSDQWQAKEDTLIKLQYVRQFLSQIRAILESVSQVDTVKYPKGEGYPSDPKQAWIHLVDVVDEYADACLWWVINDFVVAQDIVKNNKTGTYISTDHLPDDMREVGEAFSLYAPVFLE